jgi:hypothetical protein
VRDALKDSLAKAADAAAGVSAKMADLAGFGSKIQELLQVENALERAMAGIAGADDFHTTFTKLQEHLAATDEFCKRLSKPRVITFHEETV